MSSPRLINTETGGLFHLENDETLIGRDPDCKIVVPDISISGQHAAVLRSPDGSYNIRDLGSTNGTMVNGVPVAEALLTNGCAVGVGSITFRFQTDQGARASQQRTLSFGQKLSSGVRKLVLVILICCGLLFVGLVWSVVEHFGSKNALANLGPKSLEQAAPTPKPIPPLSETQQALIAGREFRRPPIDGNLFLIRKLETLYDRLSLLSGSSQIEAQLKALWKDATDAIQFIKANKLNAELDALYADFLSERDAFITLQSEIGAINADAAARLSNNRIQNSLESGNTAGTLWAQGAMEGQDTGDTLLAGALVGLTQYWLKDYQYSQELAQKRNAQHAASYRRYEAIHGSLEVNRQRLITALAARHDWKKGEVGFDRSIEEISKERDAWLRRDFALLVRLFYDRIKVRPRDPFAVRDYLAVVNELQLNDVSVAQWLEIADLAYHASLLVPVDTSFDFDRAVLASESAWAASWAMESHNDWAMHGAPNNISRLSLAYAESLLRSQPRDAEGVARLYKAKALAYLGEFSKAAETISEVIPLQQKNTHVHYVAARIQSRSGLQSEALASIKRALFAGWTDLKSLKRSPDLAPLRSAHTAEFNDLLKVKYEWYPVDGIFTDDVVLTNKSAFALTNITFRVDLKTGNQAPICRMLEKLPRLEVGQTFTWGSIMSDSAKADTKKGTLTCDQD